MPYKRVYESDIAIIHSYTCFNLAQKIKLLLYGGILQFIGPTIIQTKYTSNYFAVQSQ